MIKKNSNTYKSRYGSKRETKKKNNNNLCKVTNCSPNPIGKWKWAQ